MRRAFLFILTCVFLTSCTSVRLKYVPPNMPAVGDSGADEGEKIRLLVVDRGDWRGTKHNGEDFLGTGFYVLSKQMNYHAVDEDQEPLAVNTFMLNSLAEDLQSKSYAATVVADRYTPIRVLLSKKGGGYDYYICGRLIRADSYHRNYGTLVPFFHHFEGHFTYHVEVYRRGSKTPVLSREYDSSVQTIKFVKLLILVGTPLDSLMGHVAVSDINKRVRVCLNKIVPDIENCIRKKEISQ